MIILKMWGGLGNQMFIYALYKNLLQKGRNVKVDMSYFTEFSIHNGYELENLFGVNIQEATKQECRELAEIGTSFYSKLRRKFFRKKTHFIPKAEEAIKYIPEIFNMNDVYLQGYWQREEYFSEIQEIILHDFSFLQPMNKESSSLKEHIQRTNSVSVHIRRGDYLNSNISQKIFHKYQKNTLAGVCTKNFYQRAVNYISNKIERPTFFIFSNDIDWCTRNLSFKNAYFITHNTGIHSSQDMRLMSFCKHNIIANSSFSWWGAWLNRNSYKTVLCPNKWFNSDYDEHCALDTWTKI